MKSLFLVANLFALITLSVFVGPRRAALGEMQRLGSSDPCNCEDKATGNCRDHVGGGEACAGSVTAPVSRDRYPVLDYRYDANDESGQCEDVDCSTELNDYEFTDVCDAPG